LPLLLLLKVLKAGGLRDENIVVMMADDLASNIANPYPGKIFNKPKGLDVYEGVLKDYTGAEVTAKNLLKVLAGDAEAMKGIGSGKVIASGPDDTVFFYFADHGAPGILGMPFGPFLYADEFISTLVDKSFLGGFDKMVVFIEACESGSIFKVVPCSLDPPLCHYCRLAILLLLPVASSR
jgi:legumain